MIGCAASPVVLTLGLVAFACVRDDRVVRPEVANRPNVILVSLDTLRADALDRKHADGAPVAPQLRSFASEAVRFERAFAPQPHTLVSHMSLFTGLRPGVHGVVGESIALAATLPTLPEMLRDAGYQTLGIATSAWLKPTFGFDRGFDSYELVPTDETLVWADRVNAQALALLEARDRSRPFLLFLHYYDAHSDWGVLPYHAPEPFQAAARADEASRYCDDQQRCGTEYLARSNANRTPLTPPEVERIAELYDAGVSFLDDRIGALFRELQARGVYDDSLVVVAADHGEEFREHGSFLHENLYVETLRVPLLVRFPGADHAGKRIRDIVELVDVAPTLLDYLSIPVPRLEGRSLLPAVEGAPADRFALSQHKHAPSRYGLRHGRHFLVRDLRSGKTELYDVDTDPSELRDLSRDEVDVTTELTKILLRMVDEQQRLRSALDATPTTDVDALTDDERAQLRALGYAE